MSQAMNIACIGECMIEVAGTLAQGDQARLGFGGDTLNTAIYMARLLGDHKGSVEYVTLLGDDPYSDSMLEAWEMEGLGCRLVERCAGREAGLYTIHVDKKGERSFRYWRQFAPVRELFEGEAGNRRLDHLARFDAIFFSGITLAVLFEESRNRLLDLAQQMKSSGRMVVFDTNYREQLWAGSDARRVNLQALKAATIALPSSEDLAGIFGHQRQGWASFLENCAIPEIVLKHGGEPIDLLYEGAWHSVILEKISRMVDTTAAGDSFNAGYLTARIRGQTPKAAILQGHELARVVIGHPGAIIPRSAMP
ncbi:sugar kinase [Sedimenticola hydrogenitrophicus]|uniref:sugar kinase n=1 Tax=Sedimenticola hydrogenitrophicus TaxID=2967975 RepID=UPI002FFB4E7D